MVGLGRAHYNTEAHVSELASLLDKLAIPYLAGGALVVETAFGYPGLAALVAEAAANRDAILLSSAGMVLATVVVRGFLLAETAGRPRRAG